MFSPHHASDGFSGLRVLHDFFTVLTDPDNDLGGPLPVQRPLLHRWFGLRCDPPASPWVPAPLTRGSRYWQALVRGAVQCCLQRIVLSELRSFTPVLPVLPASRGELTFPFTNIIRTLHLAVYSSFFWMRRSYVIL